MVPLRIGDGCPVEVGQFIDVHWVTDDVWYRAKVVRVATDGSACATLRYTFDNEVSIHDLSEVTWRLAVPDATSQIRALADDSAMSIADFILRR